MKLKEYVDKLNEKQLRDFIYSCYICGYNDGYADEAESIEAFDDLLEEDAEDILTAIEEYTGLGILKDYEKVTKNILVREEN